MNIFDDPEQTFSVVTNGEEQYSIWPEGREVPAGWATVGVVGLKSECLAYIDKVWIDMRPASLRQAMSQAAGDSANPNLPGAIAPSIP
jgi:MbtH protein